MAVRIVADSGSDISGYQHDLLSIVPLHVTFGEETYLDGVELTHQEFYEKLIEYDTLPVSSQANPSQFLDVITPLIEAGDEVVIVCMSSELSGTYQSACIAAADFDSGVYVIDSLSVSIGTRALVDYALKLAESGKPAAEIAEILLDKRDKLHAMAMLDTLEYLKKGGRINPAVALAGSVLQLKPVIATKEGRVDLLGAARGSKKALARLEDEAEKYGGMDFEMPIWLGYSGLSDAVLKKYIADCAPLLEKFTSDAPIMTIGCAVGTHSGPGAIAVGFFSKE